MNLHERIEAIRNAIAEVQQLVEQVDRAVQGSDMEANYRAYGRYGFDTLLGNGNQYDSSLETLLDGLKERRRNYCDTGLTKGDTVLYRGKQQRVRNIATDGDGDGHGSLILLEPLGSWVGSSEVTLVEDETTI